jgi:lysozyme
MKYDREDLVNKLITHEGLRLQVYKDTLGIDTIGIGRNLKDRGITDEELEWMDIPSIDTVYEHGITEADAMYLAQNDVQIVEEELVRAHPCVEELDAVRQLILIDMAFNMGVPRLSKFKKMWAAIDENKFDVAAKEMLDSRWATQVKSRSTKLAHAMHHGEFNG